MTSKGPRREQKDVLARKDGVTKSGRGLQIWEEQGGEGPDGVAGQAGEASQGTAERAAVQARAQESGEGREE